MVCVRGLGGWEGSVGIVWGVRGMVQCDNVYSIGNITGCNKRGALDGLECGVYPSINLSICLSVYPYVYLPVHLSICLSVYR